MTFSICVLSTVRSVWSVRTLRNYRKLSNGIVVRRDLSPVFIDRCFNFLSIVSSDSAEGSVASASVFNRCSFDNTAKVLKTHIISKKPYTKSSLFRRKCSSSFLILNFTRSFLYSTEMYSVYCRHIIILSLRNVKLHLSFDYTDRSFVDDILSTDISVFSFFNK